MPLGGDDLVCVAVSADVGSNTLSVDAGTGNDVVDTTGSGGGYYVSTTLGAGADTFVGGVSGDAVWTGAGTDPMLDAETDVVSTGDSGDVVWSGEPTLANHDQITTGPMTDHIHLRSATIAADGLLDGGTNPDGNFYGDTLSLEGVRSGDLTLDMGAGTLVAAGSTATFSGFESAAVTAGDQRVSYHGTDRGEILTVTPTGGSPTLAVAMLGGDDRLFVAPADVAAGSVIDTGSGADEAVVARQDGTLGVDLAARRLDASGAVSRLAGLEDVFLMAPTVSLVGDRRDNDLFSNSCDATIRGGAGDDRLRNAKGDPWFEDYRYTCTPRSDARGGPGSDRLVGSGGKDRLDGGGGRDHIGGGGGNDRLRGGGGNDVMHADGGRDDVRGDAGRDVADGGRGRDTCVAERERKCER